MERTLVIIKPCAVQRGLIGEVLSRFERRGLKLVAMKMTRLDADICRRHYAHLVDKPFYPIIEESMTAAPVVLCCMEGIDAVEVVRTMAGATNGRKALPGTIRGDYCVSHQENIIHASDSLESAAQELERFFKPEDYCGHDTPLLDYLYAKDEL
ncbi:MAG: nucleoside-diphosphate kinase [Bacteroidales bacterium]|nr:nucleoside-diphosphate kinase [Bacteroidales bacterium]